MIKIFNKWSVEGITVSDTGVADYVTLDPKIVPKTGARYAGQKFHKSKVFIVERLINKIMVPGHRGKKHFRSSGQCCGKKSKAYNAVEKAFGMIEFRLNMVARGIQNQLKLAHSAVLTWCCDTWYKAHMADHSVQRFLLSRRLQTRLLVHSSGLQNRMQS